MEALGAPGDQGCVEGEVGGEKLIFLSTEQETLYL